MFPSTSGHAACILHSILGRPGKHKETRGNNALLIRRLQRCLRGQDTVEYILLILLIALATTAGIMAFADALGARYVEASGCLPIPGQGPADGVPGIGPPDCKGGRSQSP